jgi:hypothetical protein
VAEPPDDDLDRLPKKKGRLSVVLSVLALVAATITFPLHEAVAGGLFCVSGALFIVAGRVPVILGRSDGPPDRMDRLIASGLGAVLIGSGVWLVLGGPG